MLRRGDKPDDWHVCEHWHVELHDIVDKHSYTSQLFLHFRTTGKHAAILYQQQQPQHYQHNRTKYR